MKFAVSSSRLLVFSLLGSSIASALLPAIGFGRNNQQDPFSSPELNMDKSHKGEPPADVPIVSDSLSVQRDVSIFADILRGVSSAIERLENKGINTTVLAPLNSVMARLPRKPWEDPDPSNNVEGAFAGLDGENRAAANLERFVKAHMIPVSPFKENEKVDTLGGTTIWWSTENGVTKIFPGGIEVKEVKNSVPNGQVWTLTGVINYSY
ncbi:hypothetical protein DRE_06069 [Drechslerella stenobrocha 248]|uniref:FAS1 domain-containing protein n=1 Tax=Drechslerella stenobrocha 248 TaxID=1043628 RepID=W7HMG2_9PEZI|nr:hypothetical protein DRE_06069 [Drechslerella stenobrocha 248]